jgi:hypothetical protein
MPKKKLKYVLATEADKEILAKYKELEIGGVEIEERVRDVGILESFGDGGSTNNFVSLD